MGYGPEWSPYGEQIRQETIEATLGLLIQYDMQWSKVNREKGVPVGTIRRWWKKIR